MLCPKCNADVPAGSSFCSKCGERLDAIASMTRSTPRPGSDTPEEVLWEGRYSSKAMVGNWIIMGFLDLALVVGAVLMLINKVPAWWLAIVGVLVVDAFFVVHFLLKRFGNLYKLTNHRFIHEKGILNRSVNPIDLITITDVAFQQGLVERLMGVGTIKIMSNDTSDPELHVEGIDDVQNISTLIDKTRREELMRRRVIMNTGVQDSGHHTAT